MPNPLIRFRVDPEVHIRVAKVSATLTTSERRSVDHSEAARRAMLIGLLAIERCPACQSGIECALHGVRALSIYGACNEPQEIDRAEPAPTNKGDAHKEVIEHYFACFQAARGAKPSFLAADGKSVKALIVAVGVETAKQAITNAYRDPFWKGKATIRSIAGDPSRHLAKSRVESIGTWERGQEVRG